MNIKEIINGYGDWCKEKHDNGWDLYNVTIMFNQLNTQDGTLIEQMRESIEQLYTRILSRVFKRKDNYTKNEYPVWITCPDWPVGKSNKKSTLFEVNINGGLHFHGIAIFPPNRREDFDFENIIRENEHSYYGVSEKIASIHVEHISHTPDVVSDYILKSIPRNRATLDDICILPRHDTEESILSQQEKDELTAEIEKAKSIAKFRKMIKLLRSKLTTHLHTDDKS